MSESNVKSIDSKKLTKEPVLRKDFAISTTEEKAEDEVVAVILSAIMGSIIESWEIVSVEESFSEVNASYDEETNELHEHLNGAETEKLNSRANGDEYELSNQVMNEVEIINKDSMTSHNLDDTEKITRLSLGSKGSQIVELTSFQQPSIIEERRQRLTPLFENEKHKIFGWELLQTKSEVMLVFKEGNRYEGKLSSCRMHGQGKFFWADGSIYKGEFLNGEMTGKGRLEWPDQSWYEGEILRGYRNGQGLFLQTPKFYCGEWKCGQRHGLGRMFYSHMNTQRDFYSGEWEKDCKHRYGLRNYPSGAVYSGQWQMGVQTGRGTMVWTNHDVYSGAWEDGQIHGYGEYTWNTFFNTQLVVPQENCYYGDWERGIRHGNGTLETNLGVVVHGTWKKGIKHGPAEVICNNGDFVFANNLFNEDCISQVLDDSLGKDSLVDNSFTLSQIYKVPVNAPNHEINLQFYSKRLVTYFVECKKSRKVFGKATEANSFNTFNRNLIDTNETSDPDTFCTKSGSPPIENGLDCEMEEMLLRDIILQHLSALKIIYTKYSELCCTKKPNFSTVLMRIMLWQLLRDCNIHARGLSLADFDILIANNQASLVQGIHYPFERLQFWQFLHCLIEISWELYGKRCEGTASIQGILASAFHQLITLDLLPNAGRHKGNVLLKYKNLLSLDALYWFYRGIGEPHSSRKFLKHVFVHQDESGRQSDVTDYPEHLQYGKNKIGVGGKLTYIPEDEPLIPVMKDPAKTNCSQNLTSLGGVGLTAVFDCLLKVCPSIAAGNLIINMDYKVTFLEFYEILLLCAKLNIKMKNAENKKDEEVNKLENEDLVVEKVASNDKAEEKTVSGGVKTKKSPKKKGKK